MSEQSTDAAHRTEARILLLRCAGQSLGDESATVSRGLAEVAGDERLEARLWCWSASLVNLRGTPYRERAPPAS